MKQKIPFSVTILIAVVLTFTAINFARLFGAISEWEALTRLGVRPSPLYMVLTGIIWTAVGLGLATSLASGHPNAKRAAFVLVPLYAGYYWFERLVLQNAVQRENTLFSLAVTILVVFYTAFALLLPSAMKFFSQRYYGQSKN